MAIVVISTNPGMTAEHYEALAKEGTLSNGLPEGCTAQIAGPSPDGWQVISVWESPDVAYKYSQEVIIPMMQAAGIPPSDVPPVFYPLHRLVTA